MPGLPLSRVLLALLSTLFLLACGEARRPPNVILISIDTLRADHLGSYGYERDTSPHLDRFAGKSVRYANALAPAPWTLPSHAGMLTGRHPFEMGVTEQDSRLPDHVHTLAETLSGVGYQSAAFVDSLKKGFVGAERGFDRGFDLYSHAPHVRGADYRYDMKSTVDVTVQWLEKRDPERPFFLFLHTKSVHTAPADPKIFRESDAPYHKPPAYRRRFLEGGKERFRWTDEAGASGVAFLKNVNRRILSGEMEPADFPDDRLEELVGLYDAGIAYVDDQFARLLDELARMQLDEDTIVIVTADHGEAFLDNRLFLHKEVYGAVLRVPLIVHDPRRESGDVVQIPVSILDITPTVLQMCGLRPPPRMAGRPLALGRTGRVARSFFSSTAGGLSKAAALEEDGWKLVLQREDKTSTSWSAELFHTAEDPLDQKPVSNDPHEAELHQRLMDWLESTASGSGQLELDEETMDELRALGYGQ